MFFPQEFLNKMKLILGDSELEKLTTTMDTHLRKSIRINTLRGSLELTKSSLEKQGFKLESMPWYENGFFISNEDKTKRIGNTLEHYLGKIYVQETSSMLPVIALDPKPEEHILDMCAAPGSKTSQIAMHMQNKGLIVANEPLIQRIKPLQENLDRSGCINVIVTRNDGRKFSNHKELFDKVLLDAPCSSEGTFQKDIQSRYAWSINKVKQLSILQKQLFDSAYNALKKDGTLIYSTCTLSPEENEEIIDYALNKYDLEIQDLKFKGLNTSNGLTKYLDKEFNEKIKKSVRVWPQNTNIEGFFVTKLKKL
jgi:NOL1/NOP2/sun family putative RNA methylase